METVLYMQVIQYQHVLLGMFLYANSMLYFKELGKEKQSTTEPEENNRDKSINKIRTRKAQENKTGTLKINKIDKSLTRLTKTRKKDKLRNGKGDITDTTKMLAVTRDCYE